MKQRKVTAIFNWQVCQKNIRLLESLETWNILFKCRKRWTSIVLEPQTEKKKKKDPTDIVMTYECILKKGL